MCWFNRCRYDVHFSRDCSKIANDDILCDCQSSPVALLQLARFVNRQATLLLILSLSVFTY